jgi:AraC-like DNA-binding protein
MGQSVGAGYVQALFDFAVSRGANAQTLAQLSGYNRDIGADLEARVDNETYKSVMRHAKILCEDPAFPLHFGAQSEFIDMSIVGLITHSARTMGEAFEQLNRFARLMVEVDGHEKHERFAIERRDQAVWLVDKRANPNEFPELTESTFARFIWDTARHLGPVPFAKSVHVTHRAPVHSDAYENVFGVPVEFECAHNAIAIHESWLSIQLPTPNRYVFGILSERAQKLLSELTAQTSIRAKVETHLMEVLHKGGVTMDSVAAALGQSRSTLYRKLKEEGATFDTVVDDLRNRLAVSYLADKKISMAECGYLLGFSDPASFSRAYKRWIGKNETTVKN